ncbi:MAG: MerR family transcriptional regulator [Treponemataceae bacterium]|nr:MAG: MerR family transcriptional regulator [Treponemataceae bacterium]
MKSCTIGEVENIIGVKAHVLRYWEEIIPGIAPQKDMSGRRIYSQRDIEKFSRLKYLIYEKKFTIEGARNQLISEAADIACAPEIHGELLRQLSGTRAELLEIYRLASARIPAHGRGKR